MKLFFFLPFLNFLGNTVLVTAMIGGYNETASYVPYLASIFYGGSYRCGGTIVSPYWIITAAHCVLIKHKPLIPNVPEIETTKESLLAVRVGSSHYDNTDDSLMHPIEFYTLHKFYKFEYRNHENDIALIKLKTPIAFGKLQNSIPIVCGNLPSLKEGDDVTISGFGRINNNGKRPHYIQQIKVPVVSITELKFQTFQKGHGVCSGDSGSPVVYKGVLVGIVSTNAGDCSANYPDSHVRVSAYTVNWIAARTLGEAVVRCPT